MRCVKILVAFSEFWSEKLVGFGGPVAFHVKMCDLAGFWKFVKRNWKSRLKINPAKPQIDPFFKHGALDGIGRKIRRSNRTKRAGLVADHEFGAAGWAVWAACSKLNKRWSSWKCSLLRKVVVMGAARPTSMA